MKARQESAELRKQECSEEQAHFFKARQEEEAVRQREREKRRLREKKRQEVQKIHILERINKNDEAIQFKR